MYEAKFAIDHLGCWTQGLTQFQSEFITHNTVSFKPEQAMDVTVVNLRNNEKQNILDYLKNQTVVLSVTVLEETNSKLVLQIKTNTACIKSIVSVITEHGCFLPTKVPMKDGREIWTIAASEKVNLSNAIEAVKRIGDFKLLHIKKTSFEGYNLSEQQEFVMKSAMSLGFYEYPKRITITQLASQLGLAKATVQEHIRKAELKVMRKEFDT